MVGLECVFGHCYILRCGGGGNDLFARVRIHVRNISRHGLIAMKASGWPRGLFLLVVLFDVAPVP